jgi:hypothetical protein
MKGCALSQLNQFCPVSFLETKWEIHAHRATEFMMDPPAGPEGVWETWMAKAATVTCQIGSEGKKKVGNPDMGV